MGKEMTPRQLHNRRERIILSAAESGLFRMNPWERVISGITKRDENIGLSYNLSDSPGYQIGDSYRISASRVRKISGKFLEFVWKNASPNQKRGVTLGHFVNDQIQIVEKKAARHTAFGAVRKVRLVAEGGVKNIDEIASITASPIAVVRSAARTLNRFGYCIDVEVFGKYERDIRKINSERDYKKIREMMQALPGYILRYYCYTPLRGDKIPPFSTLGSIVRETGYNTRDLSFWLNRNRLAVVRAPIKRERRKTAFYKVVRTKDEKRIKVLEQRLAA